MPQSGYTGISFPFRISNRGGVVMTTTGINDATHITESIMQIFSTSFLERPMESDIYTTITSLLFEPNDVTLQQVLKERMVDDITRLEERVQCKSDDIEFTIDTEDDVEYLYAMITFKVIKYNTYYTSKVKVGEIVQ